jgi:hypothetical protein
MKKEKGKVKIYDEYALANVLGVELDHNGYRGGNESHGGFVKIKFKDLACTSMYLNGEEVEEFEFEFRGDHERYTLLKALKMIVEELQKDEDENQL